MTMNVYRPRPLHIEAIRYDGTNIAEIQAFAGPALDETYQMSWVWDSMLDRDLPLAVGFYVVKTTMGSFTVMHPDLLDATHEQVGGL